MKIFSNWIDNCKMTTFLLVVSITYFPVFTNCADKPSNSYFSTPSQNSLNPLMPEEQKDQLEKLLIKTLDQLKAVDATIEDLATVVSNDIVTKIRDKGAHLIKLRLTREIITSLTAGSYVMVDEEIIYTLIYIIRSITCYLIDAIEDGFYDLDYFDIGHIYIPHVNSISIDDLERKLYENSVLLSHLDYQAASVGLCWYNKIYRNVKKKVSHPWRKYHLGPALLVSSIASTAGFLLWWHFGGKTFPQWLRNLPLKGNRILGWPLEMENKHISNDESNLPSHIRANIVTIETSIRAVNIHNSEDQINAKIREKTSQFSHKIHPIGMLGQFESNIAQLFYTNTLPITAGACALVGYAAKLLYPHIHDWASQKYQELDNLLMGGAYRHRPVGNIQYLSKISFEDIIGCEFAKEIGRQLCLYLKDPERFDRAKLTPAKGYLLVGETRTGKSYFVEALLGELQRILGTGFGGFKIYKISYALVEKEGIETILSWAKDVAPCILFIDEIDLLGLQRSQDRKRLSEFLTAMSGYLSEIDPDKAVIIIGATNKQESIDLALTQPGRFGIILPFERPNYSERKDYIQRELTKLAINLELFDIDKLARETEGYVFEAIGLVIKKAMIHAKVNNEPITQERLEKSFDETIRGILEDTNLIPQEQKEMLAVHQAGHALANILLDPRLKLAKVTIQKVRADIKEQAIWVQAWKQEEDDKQKKHEKHIEYGKIFYNHEKDALEFENEEELLKQCKVMLAGHVAERILLDSCAYSYHADDRQKALKMAQSIIFGGLTLDQLPKKVKDQLLSETYNLMSQCEQEVEILLSENKDKLQKLAQTLQEHGTLSIREIQTLLNKQSEETATKKKEIDNPLHDLLSQKQTNEEEQKITDAA